MARTKERTPARDRILAAAEDVVVERGAAHLTLDAVAEVAEVSKGGLLYHFASKEDLLRAMLARHLQAFDADQERMTASMEGDPAAGLKAYIRAGFSDDPRRRKVSAALLAAGAADPRLLAPVREWRRRRLAEFGQGMRDPLRVMMVMLALDGFWMGETLQTLEAGPKLRRDLLKMFTAMAEGAA